MKSFVFAGVLLVACCAYGQQPAPAPNPPSQNPAQTPPAQNPPAPTLEQPKMEEPGTAPEEEKKTDTPAVKNPAPVAKAPAAKAPTHTGEGKVVEEIIARVNNEIITKSELDKARAAAGEQAQQECSGRCTPEQLQVATEDAQKFALRDLIDQSLLSQRGKDMGISVETEVVKQLDQIRQQNKLKDMDDLEKAVESQGINWEDFKSNIRNKMLTQEVIRREVGGHITITHEDALNYYNAHKQEYERPEQIALSAIEVKTEGKKESEVPELKAKAEKLRQRVLDGEDFSELAKRFSDGTTAQQGGFLGVYKQSELTKELWDAVAPLKKKQMTDVIETKQGFLILEMLEHYTEGVQPFDKVENEIMDKLYTEKMEPALREYLKTLREQSYVVVKPGYQDMAGGGNSEIQEVSATPEQQKEKKGKKKYLLFGKTSEPKS